MIFVKTPTALLHTIELHNRALQKVMDILLHAPREKEKMNSPAFYPMNIAIKIQFIMGYNAIVLHKEVHCSLSFSFSLALLLPLSRSISLLSIIFVCGTLNNQIWQQNRRILACARALAQRSPLTFIPMHRFNEPITINTLLINSVHFDANVLNICFIISFVPRSILPTHSTISHKRQVLL